MSNLSIEEQKKVDELAAYMFEPSADVQMCSGLLTGVILRMRERRAKCPICGFMPCKLSHGEASDGPSN